MIVLACFLTVRAVTVLQLCRRGSRPHIVVFDETNNKFLKVRWNVNQGTLEAPSQDPSIQAQNRITQFFQFASSSDSEVYRFMKADELEEAKSRQVRTLHCDHVLDCTLSDTSFNTVVLIDFVESKQEAFRFRQYAWHSQNGLKP